MNEEITNGVDSIDNHIYFYTEVNSESILKLVKLIRQISLNSIVKGKFEDRGPSELVLHINSDGGSIFDAFSAFDAIKASQVPIVTIAEGCVASAATFLLLAGKSRMITPNSFVLIHQLSHIYSRVMKHEELKDETYNSELLMQHINFLYKKHTKMPNKILKDMLKRDLFLNASQCIDYKIVDKIIS